MQALQALWSKRDLAAIVLDGADGPTFVLDAGALTRLAEITDALRCQRGTMVITPHTGEMATLLGIPRRAVMAIFSAAPVRLLVACKPWSR